MNVAEEKTVVRREMRIIRKRIALDPADRGHRSAEIWARVRATLDRLIEPCDAGRDTDRGPSGGRTPSRRDGPVRVMLFESLPGEPDTSSWMDDATGRGWDVFIPEVDGPHLRVMPGDLDPARLDAVIVPGLAFTADGQRLGQGGGHYDRFLVRLRANCLTVGVCFREQLFETLPTEPHDLRVMKVISS